MLWWTPDDESRVSSPVSQPPPLFDPAPATVAPATPVARLPLPTMVLVGRQPEAIRLRQLLLDEESRLITLVGPDGIGKTRLVLHRAHMIELHFANGAYFVPFVSLECIGATFDHCGYHERHAGG